MLKWIMMMVLLLGVSGQVYAQGEAAGVEVWRSSYALEIKGEYEKAAAVLLPLMDEGSNQEYARMRYAWLHYMQGNFNDAIRGYKRVLKQNARSIDARLGVSLPLMAQGRWQEASRYVKQVLALSPLHYTAHLRLMVCEEALRHWADLEKHALSLGATYPSDTTFLVYLARAYAWQNKVEDAQATYWRVLARYPEHLEARKYIDGNESAALVQ
ncbi:MAG: tetratricopeptide repeat protein [Ghiorsea sp.]